MPHYVTGEVAQIGDYVRGQDGTTGPTFVGQVAEVNPDTDTCNATLVVGGKPVRLSNGEAVIDGTVWKVATVAELELLHAAPQPAEGSSIPDAAGASGVAEEVGSGG